MGYDLLSGYSLKEDVNFLTFAELSMLASEHPDKVFRFLETGYYPQEVISWRGSYKLPAILCGTEKCTGKELFELIKEGLNTTHYGYKGGEYEYDEIQEPYLVCAASSCEEYKICGYKLQDEEVVLLTKIDEY